MVLEIAPDCPPWLAGLAGYGLGAMSRDSLLRLFSILRQSTSLAPQSSE